jgi:S-DNA-T family DNA segregation ATPase FtsK/SpoIIIE
MEMIGGILAGICISGIAKCLEKGTGNVKKEWKLTMGNSTNSKNKPPFELMKVIPKHYGFDCIVWIPYGHSYDELVDLQPKIENGFNAQIVMEKVKDNRCAYMKVITKPYDYNLPFAPVQVKPHEIFIGTTPYYKDIISDMRIHPHVLVSGATGVGKSVLMFMLILNLVCCHDENDVLVYLTQISDKKDLRIFKDVKNVKYYAETLCEATKVYAQITHEMQLRNKIISQYMSINSLDEYNKKFPSKKLPYIYVFTDEFSFYMESESDSDEDQYYKILCNRYFDSLVKQARSVGIFLVTGLQRPDKENMPPIFKSQLCTRIAMGQSNTASSLVVIDDGEAVNLDPREAIILLGNKRFKITTNYVDLNVINEYLVGKTVENPNYINISGFHHIESMAKAYRRPKNSKKVIMPEFQQPKQEQEVAVGNESQNNITDIQQTIKNKKKNKGVIE